jgi:polyisoprenoid-binding protein YceI
MEKNLIIDSSHSEVGFKVKHLMISTVRGNFKTFGGGLSGEMNNLSVDFMLDTKSISTGNDDRDNHLKSPEFFDSEKYPSIRFVSNGYNVGDESIVGDLTIKGVTRVVTLNSEYNGTSVDPWGIRKHGFEFSGKISRDDFDLTWNAALETGGVLVSDDVILTIDLQVIEQVMETVESEE